MSSLVTASQYHSLSVQLHLASERYHRLPSVLYPHANLRWSTRFLSTPDARLHSVDSTRATSTFHLGSFSPDKPQGQASLSEASGVPISSHAPPLGGLIGKMADNECYSVKAPVTFVGEEEEDDSENLADSSLEAPSEESIGRSDSTQPECWPLWALVSQRDLTRHWPIETRISPTDQPSDQPSDRPFVCFVGFDSETSDLVLHHCSDTSTEHRYAALVYANGSFHLKDLNSTYGTYINERRVPSRCFVKLNERDQIRFGFSSDVYRLQRVRRASADSVPLHLNGSGFMGKTNKTGPMNKLLRFKSGKSKAAKEKSHKTSEDLGSHASSKLSPSSSSLMSSVSSNSSSSSTTSPSSVFMSAMKMMKLRFKKRSSKEKSLECSANEDITFIRYESLADGGRTSLSHSASAPESPSETHLAPFGSHTYLNDCCFEYTSNRSKYGRGDSLEEHDYDEVARDDEAIQHEDRQVSLTDDVIDQAVEDEEDTYNDICDDVYTPSNALDQLREESEAQEPIDNVDGSTTSSVIILPHLNSEDRLNNNSSLDAIFNESLLLKACEVDGHLTSTTDVVTTDIGHSTTSASSLVNKGFSQQLSTTLLGDNCCSHDKLIFDISSEQRDQCTYHTPITQIENSSEPCVSYVGTNYQRHQSVTSSSESPFGTVIEGEYDIDHLRRQPQNHNTPSEIVGSEAVRESPCRNGTEPEPLSLESISSADSERRSFGGMAFVINFDQEGTGSRHGVRTAQERMSSRRERYEVRCEKGTGPSEQSDQAGRCAEDSMAATGVACHSNGKSRTSIPTATTNNSSSSSAYRRRNCDNDYNCSNKARLQECEVKESPSRHCDRDYEMRRTNKLHTTEQSASTNDHREHLRTELQHQTSGNEFSMRRSKHVNDAHEVPSPASTRRNKRGSQLSESAVYLINRMFEDSEYHQRYCPDDANNDSYNNFEPTIYGSSHQRACRQSVSSSGSTSPYGMRCNSQDPSQAIYACNSSNASTRMEYDESLSSLHSNSNESSHRLPHLQSMTTVVQSPTSTLEKQVDSAIDEDADLIADDLSDTGTYTIEIDDVGQKHKKRETLGSQCELDDLEEDAQQLVKPETMGVMADEDSGENGDVSDTEDPKDKLEIARRHIDGIIDVYQRNQNEKKLQESIVPTVNNATFTRSKRRTSTPQPNTVSTDEEEEAFVNDCESASISKDKKKISSELMSALKKINSKLEKTARLGNVSLTESHQLKGEKSSSGRAYAKLPSKTRSAPSTPLLSSPSNRKTQQSRILSRPPVVCYNRKSSVTSVEDSCLSTDDLDERSSIITVDSYTRTRTESTSSTQSASHLRFNRAFALRRARLGMDTCGVEVSEQAVNKAKESQAKAAPKKVPANPFRRNDGGRFSLRAQTNTGSSRVAVPVQTPTSRQQNISRKSSNVTSSKTSVPTNSRLSHIKSHSAASSAHSSVENLSSSKATSSRSSRKPTMSTLAHNNVSHIPKASHSDNEIARDGDSSCDEAPTLFTRLGRSSLRYQSGATSSSTPWLQSLKASSQNKSRFTALPTLGTPINKSSSFSSSAIKNHSHKTSQGLRVETPIVDSQLEAPPSESVRAISSFQIGKRFFSTKPHQMAQFDRDFARCSSANSSSANKLSSDPNLMTHSATESLLSRPNLTAHPAPLPEMASHHQKNSPITCTTTPNSISSSINSRIFSISPLDSLVISAINQLSSKLRTRMRDFLERERSNHSIGSEARSLIDEILPQVGMTANTESGSSQPKSAYSNEPSHISRDLSNILKNLKKVEQIFDVVDMLSEPSLSFQEVSSEPLCSPPVVTNASDSDTSGSTPETSHPLVRQPQSGFRSSVASHRGSASTRSADLSNQSSPLTPRRSGFFIEI